LRVACGSCTVKARTFALEYTRGAGTEKRAFSQGNESTRLIEAYLSEAQQKVNTEDRNICLSLYEIIVTLHSRET
jgi:hypothetical protein